MKKNVDLLAWALSWHWPQLVLSAKQGAVIHGGEESWRAFVARKDSKSKLLAWQRIQRWTELVEVAEEEQSVDSQEMA